MLAVAAVVRNPWAGRGYVEDLKPEIRAFAPILGKLLTERIVALAGGADKIEAYGKAAMAGLDCEQEHASALIHTLHFGNFYREAVGAKSYLGFTNTRGPANTQINIPLMDKHDTGGARIILPCSSRSVMRRQMTSWSSPSVVQPAAGRTTALVTAIRISPNSAPTLPIRRRCRASGTRNLEAKCRSESLTNLHRTLVPEISRRSCASAGRCRCGGQSTPCRATGRSR